MINRIDLHTHTKKCKKGDGSSRIISVDDYINTLKRNNVSICSITNHNSFDLEEYEEINSRKELLIFPGIELDVLFNEGCRRHIIVLGDPACSSQFNKLFNLTEDFDSFAIEYDNFVNIVKKFNTDKVVLIPHFLNKDKERALKLEEKDMLQKDLSDYSFILEPNWREYGFINNHDELALVGSDIKDWHNYDSAADKLPLIKFPLSSFGQFYELISQPKTFIKNFLNNEKQYWVPISENGDFKLPIYNDINVAFGGKGSGKTILLEKYIYPYFISTGMNTFLHKGKDYDEYYNNLIEKTMEAISVNEAIKQRIINNINKVVEFSDNPIKNWVLDYVELHKKKKISKNAEAICKTESQYNKEIQESIDDIKDGYKADKLSIESVELINDGREFNVDHKASLFDELELLKDDTLKSTISKAREIFVIKNTTLLLENIKTSINKKTGKIPVPTNLGFSSMVSLRRQVYESLQQIRQDFVDIETDKKIPIGFLEDKGKIYSKVIIKVLKEDEKYNPDLPFEKNRITENRDFVKFINSFNSKTFIEYNAKIAMFREFKGDVCYNECVKLTSSIIKEDGSVYSPSDGEKSILSISGYLENFDYDCYIFDEIERGLGNKFVADYVIDKLNKLRAMGKTIIISTHNANIAINTLPTQTVYCNYIDDSQSNIYYYGNMYSDTLISATDSSSIVNWTEKALRHLEGSDIMFRRRENVWIRQ